MLASLSCLASLLDKTFENHYSKFMPGLINILQTVKSETDAEQNLRASCYDCVGSILTAVKHKPEMCKADAITITEMIVSTMNSGTLTSSDPQNESMLTTLAMICVCLKDEFQPFLATIVPQIKKDMEKDIKFSVKEADELEGEDDDDKDLQSIAVKIKGMEGAK